MFLLSLSLIDVSEARVGHRTAHCPEGCLIGDSYDFYKGVCDKASPIEMKKRCGKGASDVNCIALDTSAGHNGITAYTKKTRDESTTNTLLQAVVTAEGSGWGVSASGSVDFMTQHTETDNSVHFWKGLSGDITADYLQNPAKATLTHAARDVFKDNWRTFVEIYGTHFVERIINSVSYIGSVSVHQTTQFSKQALEVAASASYESVFSAKGSAKFSRDVNKKASQLNMEVNSFKHGKLTPFVGINNPVNALMKDFENWQNQVNANEQQNAVPTRLVFRTFFDLEEIQQMAIDLYKDDISELTKVFYTDQPAQETLIALTEEYVWSKAQLNSIKSMKAYPCVDRLGLHNKVQQYDNHLTSHLLQMDQLNAKTVIQKQEEMANDNFDWFVGRSLKFTTELNNLLKKCPAPTPSPTKHCAWSSWVKKMDCKQACPNGWKTMDYRTDHGCCSSIWSCGGNRRECKKWECHDMATNELQAPHGNYTLLTTSDGDEAEWKKQWHAWGQAAEKVRKSMTNWVANALDRINTPNGDGNPELKAAAE